MIVNFNECDKDKDYLISKEELGDCLLTSPLNQMKLTSENSTMVIESLDKGGPGQMLNFPDYLFMRRINLGWQRCAAGESLA